VVYILRQQRFAIARLDLPRACIIPANSALRLNLVLGMRFLVQARSRNWKQTPMHGEIHIDELNHSAINVHSCFLELTPCESGDPGESWFNMPTISSVDGKQTTTIVELIPTKPTSQVFFPFLCYGPYPNRDNMTGGHYCWLTGPCVSPDPLEPRTYRRCGYSSFKIPSGFNGLTECIEKFRLV
jgi:hypothetical protein